jgi:hypothetical protein
LKLFHFAWTVLRLRPISLVCTALLLVSTAGLVGVSAPLAVLAWAVGAPFSLVIWYAVEPLVVRRLGARAPDHLDWERVDPALDPARERVNVDVLVIDAAQPWLGRGLRTLVVSRALLDLLEDRALDGLLAQATLPVRSASLAGEMGVWLGNLPVLCTWWLSRILARLGRVLAVVLGGTLVVPLVLWPTGYARWTGYLLGALIVCLAGASLLSSGFAAAGLGLLLACALVPGLRAILAWETHRAELAADDATLEAGLGWQLLEALETLVWAESVPPPAGLLGVLCRTRTPLTDRADRLWKALSEPNETKGGESAQPQAAVRA